jgi:hypothetical protein
LFETDEADADIKIIDFGLSKILKSVGTAHTNTELTGG